MLLVRQVSLMSLMIEMLFVSLAFKLALNEDQKEEAASSLASEHEEGLEEGVVPLHPVVASAVVSTSVVVIVIYLSESRVLDVEGDGHC